MSIEGLGKQFQKAREERGLSLDQAARLTKIRQSRLAELEADDFSNFPSLAYAKGFLQIYGKFLGIDTAPYTDHFETSDSITVDGYSYLQENPAPKPTRAAVAPRAPAASGSRTSFWPLVVGLIVLFVGFWFLRLVLNVQRISPTQTATSATTNPAATATLPPAQTIVAPRAQPVHPPAVATSSLPPVSTPIPTSTPTAIAVATPPIVNTPSAPTAAEPEVRRAEPVSAAELAAARTNSDPTENLGGPNRVEIKPLRKTYVQVRIDDDPSRPAFERWISPSDGIVQFRGRRFNVRVLDREAVQIRKNGKLVSTGDADVSIE